ncbi:hypothetical protein [Arenimonas composti]|uniref:DUF4124 domain-containing protein n=1 Tax=Arenimonas composti TR7-09 = DSM 18010 TaxID=1121013 RepID=A0A091B6E5_9GAMM|nr:hypothetical protein [Arenimonas composti]KFN48238.1 hypothetical protein P873_01390 [Arenimonas composti TR7-09 = DSM 18010]
MGEQQEDNLLRFRRPPPRRVPEKRNGFGRNLLIATFFCGTFVVLAFGVREINRRALQAVGEGGAATAAPTPAAAPSAASAPPAPPPSTRAAPAPAPRTLYKCRAPSGDLTFIDRPCPAGHEVVWMRPYAPEAGSAPRGSPRPRSGDRGSPVYSAPAPARAPDRGPTSARCRAAKQYEADYRERRGLRITHAELRRLTDHVYEACK